jgi:hypothetical protein
MLNGSELDRKEQPYRSILAPLPWATRATRKATTALAGGLSTLDRKNPPTRHSSPPGTVRHITEELDAFELNAPRAHLGL